jgi:hypothetical protein
MCLVSTAAKNGTRRIVIARGRERLRFQAFGEIRLEEVGKVGCPRACGRSDQRRYQPWMQSRAETGTRRRGRRSWLWRRHNRSPSGTCSGPSVQAIPSCDPDSNRPSTCRLMHPCACWIRRRPPTRSQPPTLRSAAALEKLQSRAPAWYGRAASGSIYLVFPIRDEITIACIRVQSLILLKCL